MIICEFCTKSFSSNSTLKRHQTTVKSCIEIQRIISPESVKIVSYSCKYCNKNLSSKNNLSYHKKICKLSPSLSMKSEKDTVSIVNNNNDNSTNTTNNYNIVINNHVGFIEYMATKETIVNGFKQCETTELLESEKALVMHIIDKFLSGEGKPVYLCSDPSRKNFYYLDKDQNKVSDNNATVLRTLLTTFNPVEELNPSINSEKCVKELSVNLPKTLQERVARNDIKAITDNNLSIKDRDDLAIQTLYNNMDKRVTIGDLKAIRSRYNVDTGIFPLPKKYHKYMILDPTFVIMLGKYLKESILEVTV